MARGRLEAAGYWTSPQVGVAHHVRRQAKTPDKRLGLANIDDEFITLATSTIAEWQRRPGDGAHATETNGDLAHLTTRGAVVTKEVMGNEAGWLGRYIFARREPEQADSVEAALEPRSFSRRENPHQFGVLGHRSSLSIEVKILDSKPHLAGVLVGMHGSR